MLTKTAKYGTPQADATTYSYDQARTGYYNVGHQTTASNSAALIVYNFDNEGRQVGQTYTVSAVNYSFTMAFDQGGRVLSQGYPDTDSVGPLTYDAAGRLKTVPGLVTGVLYDAAGRQTNVTRQNGASTTLGWSAQRGWLNSLLTTSTAGTIQDYSYGRDARGRITGVTSPQAGDSWIYGYDDLDRLLSADNTSDNTLDQTFQYDLVGNMTFNSAVGTYSYPAPGFPRPHAVTGIAGGPLGTQSFTYDANGSMTLQGADTRTYDGLNRLASAVDGAVTTSFVYAPDGTRLKKTASGVTTLYFGDDVEIAGGVTTKYLPGDAKRVGLTTTTWLHRDHLQSVRAITNSSGAILDRANYRPFGEQLGFASVTESKGYIGERQDDETQLMYLHARYYDPVLARFIQADPMSPALPGVGVNRYAYAFNNPVMFLDPFGLANGGGGGYHHDPGGHGIGSNDNGGTVGYGVNAGSNSGPANNVCSGNCGPTGPWDPKTGQIMYSWDQIAGWFDPTPPGMKLSVGSKYASGGWDIVPAMGSTDFLDYPPGAYDPLIASVADLLDLEEYELGFIAGPFTNATFAPDVWELSGLPVYHDLYALTEDYPEWRTVQVMNLPAVVMDEYGPFSVSFSPPYDVGYISAGSVLDNLDWALHPTASGYSRELIQSGAYVGQIIREDPATMSNLFGVGWDASVGIEITAHCEPR